MKALSLITLFCLASSLAGQTVLKSPEDGKKLKNIDYENIEWTKYQQPHYQVTGFDRDLLDSDFYSRSEYVPAEAVLLEKINIYRKKMGLGRLMLNDTGSIASRNYARQLSGRKKLTHTLHGKTPTDRMKPYFPYPVGASENLLRYASTLKFEDIDSFTDYILHSWINSKGHNAILLTRGKKAGVGIYTVIDKKSNIQTTVAVFSIIHHH